MELNCSVNTKVGYDYEFIPPLEEKYECSICLLALRAPMQTSCGHRFCMDCIHLNLREVGNKCPVDNTPITEADLFLDSCVEREILQLKVLCPNNKLGCKQQLELKYISNHTQACFYQPVMCPKNCSSTVLQKELDEHMTNQCIERIVRCKLCDKPHTYKNEQVHLMECSKVTVPCEMCMKRMPRSFLHNHMTEECSHAVVSCPLAEHGCTEKMKREQIQHHMNNSSSLHLIAISSSVKKVNTIVNDLSRSIGFSGSFSRQPSLRSQLSTTSPIVEEMDKEMGGINGSSGAAGASCIESNTNLKTSNGATASYMEPDKKDMFLPLSNEPSDDDLKKPKNVPSFNEIVLRDLSEKNLDLDQRTVEQSIQINSLSEKVLMLNKKMEKLAIEISGIYCFGEYLWRLCDFSNQYQTMCENPNHTLFSVPFSDRPYGYRFCLRFNITKCPKDQEFYVTLNIHVMKGENDHLLEWPFSGEITMSILDCRSVYPKEHITEHMSTRTGLIAFERPTTPKNPTGFGFTKFVPLKQITSEKYSYIHNNILYVKAIVKSKSNLE